MPPIVIDAKKYKEKELITMKEDVKEIEEEIGRVPKLVIMKATNDKACECYVRNKVKIGKEVGIEVEIVEVTQETQKTEFEKLIFEYRFDDSVDGIIVQEPIYEHLRGEEIIGAIPIIKDADCFKEYNLGKMIYGQPITNPCTPLGVISLLKEHEVNVEGKRVTIIGRSVNVGLSLSIMLTQLGAIVTTTHSKSPNLQDDISNADVVVSCVGKKELIKPQWMKKGSVLLGVGIVYENGKQYTDYDIEDMVENSQCSMIGNRVNCTGTATVISLIKNTIELCKYNNGLYLK